MPSERELTLAAQLPLPLGNIPVHSKYGDTTPTKELFVVDVTGSAEMRRGTVAISLEKDPTLYEAAHKLYFAGTWTCPAIPAQEQAALWEALRNALGLAAGSATAALAQGNEPELRPLFHRVVGVLEKDVETKQGLLYTPTQLNPAYKRLRVTAVGLGRPDIPMPVSVGDLVVVPTDSIETVLEWTVVNALDIVGVYKP